MRLVEGHSVYEGLVECASHHVLFSCDYESLVQNIDPHTNQKKAN